MPQNGGVAAVTESDDEVTVTVNDVPPTLEVSGPSEHLAGLLDQPYKLDLDFTDPAMTSSSPGR
jgi:hypothetical protein